MPNQRNPLFPPAAHEAPEHQVITVTKRLLASWQRSQDYGVSAEGVDPVWAGQISPDSLFFQCGQEVLTAMHQTLANEPLGLMLTDADGMVLNRFSGDSSLLQALDKVHLAPGFAFSEREAGTNGLGLALADRVPSLVRAEEHYSASLRMFTCAAVPVFEPLSGRLEGCVNITTYTRSSPELLLALAQSAASHTSSLMLARSQGLVAKPGPRGVVFRVHGKLEPGAGTWRATSTSWTRALEKTAAALSAGRVVAALGEQGSGRSTLLGQALRQVHPRIRILCAAAPAPADVDAWLSLWTPELAKAGTAVIVENCDTLPAWAARDLYFRTEAALRLRRASAHTSLPSLALTAEELSTIPQPLAAAVGTVVAVPALRERPEDIVPLARHAARQTRLRAIDFTPAAERVLTGHEWPGNIDELNRVVHAAALRTEVIDVQHLPASLSQRPSRRLTHMETIEREEIDRLLSKPGMTAAIVAVELGVSRATIYRRMARLGISVPKSST
ncbi:GAF domain-containing protein [Paenarthrobacter sp. A20]|uniref:GAF domain-containing protein n=1 Tax=Paenarthrobacter sp. A20 TaxID=2817891 RepID=UPI0020A176CD|nr:GAF domain-containing protein [Paenarthrobacter sp. A20]MCP1413608.1 energy-coupling factor transporter ATP-binding protein EcfA2 [Paenarthrobacter sp. A20]